jgi:methylase of polypeptide subunit release factors
MVASALASVGVGIESAAAGLDFGCSSGRLVLVLAAAYPRCGWHGCDPNGPAIEWARGAYPRVNDLDLVALRARARLALVR